MKKEAFLARGSGAWLQCVLGGFRSRYFGEADGIPPDKKMRRLPRQLKSTLNKTWRHKNA
jgi:hypothetical protein